MARQPEPIPARVLLACPTCGQRIETALPLVAALCHDRHRATAMRPVDDTASAPTADESDR